MRNSRSFSVNFLGPAVELAGAAGAWGFLPASASEVAASPAEAAAAAAAKADKKSRRSSDMVVYSSSP
jgi:hypothetical protein